MTTRQPRTGPEVRARTAERRTRGSSRAFAACAAAALANGPKLKQIDPPAATGCACAGVATASVCGARTVSPALADDASRAGCGCAGDAALPAPADVSGKDTGAGAFALGCGVASDSNRRGAAPTGWTSAAGRGAGRDAHHAATPTLSTSSRTISARANMAGILTGIAAMDGAGCCRIAPGHQASLRPHAESLARPGPLRQAFQHQFRHGDRAGQPWLQGRGATAVQQQ